MSANDEFFLDEIIDPSFLIDPEVLPQDGAGFMDSQYAQYSQQSSYHPKRENHPLYASSGFAPSANGLLGDHSSSQEQQHFRRSATSPQRHPIYDIRTSSPGPHQQQQQGSPGKKKQLALKEQEKVDSYMGDIWIDASCLACVKHHSSPCLPSHPVCRVLYYACLSTHPLIPHPPTHPLACPRPSLIHSVDNQ